MGVGRSRTVAFEQIDAIWREIPDFRESYEVAEGFFRRNVPAYDEKVVRELLVNALVHRPYTQRGDVFINLYPEHLEVINPGRLPLGVTPRNILHASRRRNDELARVFHDLGLMEREGSGFDLIYDRLLSQGRAMPHLEEGADWVKVTIQRRILKPEVMKMLTVVDARYRLTQRERITLGILALSEGMTANELAAGLELGSTDALKPWLGRLQRFEIVNQTGRTKGTRYFVAPGLLRRLEFPSQTSLARIEPHRLEALILEDLHRYPGSAIGEIHHRIGKEIIRRQVKSALDRLRIKGNVEHKGDNRGRRYWAVG
ncbi:ATP-binding protein [Desulfonatronum parangueonense]